MQNSKVMMGIILVLLLVLLGATGGLAFYIITSNKANQVEASPGEIQPVELQQADIELYPIADPITTNLAVGTGKDANHMLKLTISLGLNMKDKKEGQKLKDLLATRDIVIRDAVIKVISEYTYEEMKRIGGREVLRGELLQKLQEEFGTNLIVEIYIGEWNIV